MMKNKIIRLLYNFLENLLNDLMVSYINTPTNIFFIRFIKSIKNIIV